MRSFRNREVGVYEVADKLLGYRLYQFSDAIFYLQALPKDDRKRRLKELKDIHQIQDDDSTNIYFNNLIDDYYPNRPDVLEDVCLFTFAQWFEYTSIQKPRSLILKNNLGFLHHRTKPKVIKTPLIRTFNEQSIEKLSYQTLMLFVPWREEGLLKNSLPSFTEALAYAHQNKSIKDDIFNNFAMKQTRMQEALDTVHEYKKKAEASEDKHEISINVENILDLGVAEFAEETVDPEHLKKMVDNLNPDQLVVFKHATNIIEQQEKYKRSPNSVPINQVPQNARMFCSGVGGKFNFINNNF